MSLILLVDDESEALLSLSRALKVKDNSLTYGIYSGGVYTKNDMRVNSWGPYISWRQPVWRDWIFMQNDLNFFNHIDDDPKHQLSVQMNLEANF